MDASKVASRLNSDKVFFFLFQKMWKVVSAVSVHCEARPEPGGPRFNTQKVNLAGKRGSNLHHLNAASLCSRTPLNKFPAAD